LLQTPEIDTGKQRRLCSFWYMKNGLLTVPFTNIPRLDETDRKIIGELLEDGRISLAELGRRVNLSPPAVAERVKRLEQAGVITGYRAEIDLGKLGYQLTAIIRIKPSPGQLPKIPELAEQMPEVGECHRITGEDCFYLKLHLHSIDELSGLLDRFLVYGQTTTSIVNGTPIPSRNPPIEVPPRNGADGTGLDT
jgi:Lrp/AsnC family transcriptional regulator, leucine-responsive regulatory protein